MGIQEYEVTPQQMIERTVKKMTGGSGLGIDPESLDSYDVYSVDFTTWDGTVHEFLLDEEAGATLAGHLAVWSLGLRNRKKEGDDGNTTRPPEQPGV